MHDDRAIHGSQANPSPRRRAGLTVRYSGTEVKNDLAVNPNFKAYLCRGTDEYRNNPVGVVPTQRFGRPDFKAVSIEEAGAAAAPATPPARSEAPPEKAEIVETGVAETVEPPSGGEVGTEATEHRKSRKSSPWACLSTECGP